MNFHQLRIFSAVAKHLNFTKASQELDLCQSSVSKQLKLLEEEYGMRLYKKAGQGIELTKEGRLFLSDAELILSQVERLKQKLSTGLNEEGVGFLTIGGSHSPSMCFLPIVLAVFKETHPQVQLTLRSDTSREIERLVLDSEVEIALITNLSRRPSLIYEPYRQQKLVVFASAKHPFAKKERLTLAELAQASLIVKNRTLFHESRTDALLRELERRGVKLNIVTQCDSRQAVIAAVKAGIGLGISYGDNVEADIKAGILKKFKIPESKLKMKVDTFIIHHKERPLSPYAQEFLALLREWPQKTRCVKTPLQAP